MTTNPVLAIDTSALLRRYVADRHRPIVVEAMSQASHWAASALARSEVMLALHHGATGAPSHSQAWDAVRDDWEAMWEIPVDGRALALATDIGARYGLDLMRSLHLACASRLPEPIRFITFDSHQVTAATALGFEVVTTS